MVLFRCHHRVTESAVVIFSFCVDFPTEELSCFDGDVPWVICITFLFLFPKGPFDRWSGIDFFSYGLSSIFLRFNVFTFGDFGFSCLGLSSIFLGFHVFTFGNFFNWIGVLCVGRVLISIVRPSVMILVLISPCQMLVFWTMGSFCLLVMYNHFLVVGEVDATRNGVFVVVCLWVVGLVNLSHHLVSCLRLVVCRLRVVCRLVGLLPGVEVDIDATPNGVDFTLDVFDCVWTSCMTA